MPRVHHVKKARKDNPVAKVGEPYYWWKFRHGGKKFSKTYPKQSQLTQSEFLSQAYALNETLADLASESIDELRMDAEQIASDFRQLGEEQEEKLYNMPDSLQEGPTGELLQQRRDDCDDIAQQLEDVEFSEGDDDVLRGNAIDALRDENPDKGDDWTPGDDAVKEKLEELQNEKLEELLSDVQAIQYEGD
jgi:hypothetical protein